MSESPLFAFVDPAMRIVAACAVAFVALFFVSALSDAWHTRMLSRRHDPHERTAVRPNR
jgi:hypothetical protein